MKTCCLILVVAALWRPSFALAQTNAANSYAADVGIIIDSQRQAIEQARKALGSGGDATVHAALSEAIKEMERSQTALEAARKTPDKLPAALALEQSAYQSLLKSTPREYRLNQSRNRSQGGSGQPSEQELSQIETSNDDNRYETEKQASAQPTAQQKEQSETLDRLKQLARRQQDLNDRLRDLQTALQEAKTDSEREEIQRQLKRLHDEERQLLSDVDEMRQKMEQSPDASQQAQARQQLDQTRNDVQRAAQQLEKRSVSEALASGSRAEENMQNLRETMRQQSSSQFSQQMRQLRSEARDLAAHEEQIARDLDKVNNSGEKALDDSAQRQSLVEQMARQKSALTNMLEQMRTVTEQAESTEPLLSKQLYDIIRRADKAKTDNQLETSGQLVDHGFFPQAAEAEKTARQNLDELKQNVDRAAESILGSEADALRYAQKQLDDLTSELSHDLHAATNETASASGQRGATSGTNAAPNSKLPGNNGGSRPEEAQNASSGQTGSQNGNQTAADQTGANATGKQDKPTDLTQFAKELGQSGAANGGGGSENGPITGSNFVDWSERMRDVEQAVDSQDIRNQLATVRERVGVYRRYFRENGRLPARTEMQSKAWAPLNLARDWVNQELSRAQNERSLVPLDRDPVQDKYSDLVRKYYENLGSPQ